MGIGGSIFLIAAGAIIRFAVTLDAKIGSTRVNWNVVGDVLMAAGAIGVVISVIWMSTAARRNAGGEATYVERVDRPSAS